MPKDKITDPDVQKIVDDQKLTNADKVTKLKKMHDNERAIQRAATESPMAQDDGLNDRLHDITLALEDLGADPKGPEDNLGATL
jgi:hypothetical protein